LAETGVFRQAAAIMKKNNKTMMATAFTRQACHNGILATKEDCQIAKKCT
jgi:hypothetical protein